MLLVSCHNGINFDFQAEAAKKEILETKDPFSYFMLTSYYEDENSDFYLEALPYDLLMLKEGNDGAFYRFYENYLKICNSGKFDRSYIDKLEKPEREFLIYLLQKGALKQDEYCQGELFHFYNEGIGVLKDLKKADSIKVLFPKNYFSSQPATP
jgi:hypothetical protein